MWVYALVGTLAVIALIVLIISFICCCASSGKTKTNADILPTETFQAYENPIWKKTEVEHRESLEILANIAQSLKVYNFIELQCATDHFSHGSHIGGLVYRGKMNGDLAAIKKMKGDVSKEINSLGKINHYNLIRVMGVCFNEGHWYLVYEYASNGTLCDWIFDNNVNQKLLSWTQRMQIVVDVAKGLNYIHDYNNPPYIFKDVKSSNILLDSDFTAKISNSSPTRSAETVKLAQIAAERKAYLPPEYSEKGQVSTKVDVYGFGILLLELLMGKEASILYEQLNGNLSTVFAGVSDEAKGQDRLRDFIDPSLKGNYPFECVLSVTILIENCLKRGPSSRPDMEENVKYLSKVLSTSMAWESSI